MPDRRAALKLAAAALAAPLVPRAAAAATPADPQGEIFLVNGWVLTRADVEMVLTRVPPTSASA